MIMRLNDSALAEFLKMALSMIVYNHRIQENTSAYPFRVTSRNGLLSDNLSEHETKILMCNGFKIAAFKHRICFPSVPSNYRLRAYKRLKAQS